VFHESDRKRVDKVRTLLSLETEAMFALGRLRIGCFLSMLYLASEAVRYLLGVRRDYSLETSI
jgi:hypothetical protein